MRFFGDQSTPGRNTGSVVARAKDAPVPLYDLILQRIPCWGSISLSNGDIGAAGCLRLLALDGDTVFLATKESAREEFFRGQADRIF